MFIDKIKKDPFENHLKLVMGLIFKNTLSLNIFRSFLDMQVSHNSFHPYQKLDILQLLMA